MLPSSFVLLCVIIAVLSNCKAVPKQDRVIHKDLSEKEHYHGEEHNPDYDHDAFLGEDAAEFEDLSPEESKERLGKLFFKIDLDGDGKVTEDELRQWIQHSQRKYLMTDLDKQWKLHNEENKDKITWEDYKKTAFGYLEDNPEDHQQYEEIMKRDERRWKLADSDGDGVDKEEFMKFLHPQEYADMKHIVVLETLEDIDKDKDGKISLEEYIKDMYYGDADSEEPYWVQEEREQFSKFRDKNGDGFLTEDEVRDWILPEDYEPSIAEARHLVFESDSDKDGVLTQNEVLEHYDVFVGSQATDFGEFLTRHEEF